MEEHLVGTMDFSIDFSQPLYEEFWIRCGVPLTKEKSLWEKRSLLSVNLLRSQSQSEHRHAGLSGA